MTKKLMILAAAVAVAFGAWAETETVGGYTWTYRISGDTAEIYNDGGVAVSPAPTDVLSIPSTLGGKTMTSIGNDAFRGCISLTGVTIPDTVTKIGSGAFYGCEQLTLLKIPDSVKTIGNYAFYNCVALSSLHLGSGVERINFFTFGHCRSLMNLDIPDTVTSIADSAFYGCTGLTRVTIPIGVTSIIGGAFEACDNLRIFEVAGGNTSFSVKDGLLYNKEGTCLIRCPYGLTEVVVPNGVTRIGYRAFSANNSLVKVTLPEGVAQIDDCAFIYCRSLKDLTIPNCVTNIGDSVFQFCGKLTSISFPESLSTIGGGEFYGCSNLTNIIFGGNAPSVGNNCFAGVGSSCTVRVLRDSSGWGVDIPGTWNGMRIEYLPVMVTDVVAKQRYPWNGLVDITCKVTGIEGTAIGLKLAVAAVMPDSGITRKVSHFWLVQGGTNSVDREVHTNGNYRLLWDARADLGIVRYTNMVVRISFDAHEKVQLWEGGPYWATTNIGAEKPEDYGYYFWWGDTVGYKREGDAWVATDGSSSNFSFGSSNTPTYNKSIATLQSEGWIVSKDGTYVLAPEHDAAQVQWGGGWRMPTDQDVSELRGNCNWTWMTTNGVSGYIVRGRGDYTSSSIFLPAAGSVSGSSLYKAGLRGYYWASVPRTESEYQARGLSLYSDGHSWLLAAREIGQTVRPILWLDDATMTPEQASAFAQTGDSESFLLDTMDGIRIAKETETLAYSTEWNDGSAVQVAVDGVTLKEAVEPASGDVAWNAANAGIGGHALTHTSGGETLTARFAVLGDDVEVHGGTIARNEVWSTNKVHLVAAPIVLGDNNLEYFYELVIQPGTIVKFMPGTGLSIESNAYCTASGAIFTHVNDDTIGGDTLMDGDETAPVMNEYDVPNMLVWDDEIEFRYFSDPKVTLSGTISADEIWRGHNIYCVTGNLTVASGKTLTIMPGAIVKFAAGLSLTVNGTLDAQGTRAAPIVFTSLKDDEHGGDANGDGENSFPDMGDWKNIAITGNVKFSHVKCLYGGGVSNSSDTGMLAVRSGGKLSLDCCILAHGLYDGVFSYGTVTGENTIIYDCDRGVNTSGGTGVFRNCVVDYCRWGVMAEGGSGTYYNCIITRFFGSNAWPTGWGVAYWSGSLKTYNCCVWSTLPGASNYRSSPTVVNNMSVNPRYIDPDNGDFRLAANSPCINAGDATNAPEFDYYAQPRDGVPDIGIYEVVSETGYDLAATAVNAQAASSTIGEIIEVSYDVANVGRLAVTDPWHDALYLVSTTSGKQYALGESLNSGAIGTGESRTFTCQFAFPVVPVGQYRLRLVVNNRRMDVPEGAATENNVRVSEGEIEVVADNIDAANGASGSVAAGASSVCAFTLPSGSGDRLMRVTSSAGGATLSARCGLGFLPVNADSGTALSFSGGAAWISVPAGTEKVWLVLDNGGTAAAPYEVEFIDGSLTLSGISPASIPSSGNVTVEIAGAGFTDVCEVSFTGAGTVAPLSVTRVSQELLAATVDAAAFASGKTYSVAVKKGTETKTLQDAVSVAAAPGEPKFWAKLDVPSSMRQGRLVETCFIEYGNSGTADMLSPVLQVSMTGDGTLGYIGGLSGLNALQFVAAGDAGSAGVLRPGSSKRIRFAVRAGASNKISLHTSEGSDYAPAPWTNAADYLADLSAAATRIDLRGQDATDYVRVFDLAKAVKNGEPSSAICGRVVDENGEGMAGANVSFYDSSSNLVSCVSADASGRFVSDTISNGSYWMEVIGIPLSEVDSVFDVSGGEDVIVRELRCVAAPSIRVIFENVPAGKRIDVALTSFDGLENIRPYWENDNVARFYGADGNAWTLTGKADDLVCFATVSPSEGETVELSCVMSVGCEISGRVDDVVNTGAKGVIIVGENGLYRFVGIDDSGSFAIADLPAGEYAVAVLGVSTDDYEVVSELVLTENDAITLTFSPNMTGKASFASSSVKLNSTKVLKSAKSWTWPWNLRSTLLDYIGQMDRRIKATEMLVVEPNPDCKHNLAKYKSDKDVLDKIRTQLSAMNALYDETERSFYDGVWDNLGKSASNFGTVLAKIKMMQWGKLNGYTSSAIDMCNDYATERIDGKTVIEAIKDSAAQQVLPVGLSVDDLFNLPARAKSVWDRKGVWVDLLKVWEGDGDEKFDKIVQWEKDVISICEDVRKAKQLINLLVVGAVSYNNPAAAEKLIVAKLKNLKEPISGIGLCLDLIEPILKYHVHLMDALRDLESGARAHGIAHSKIRTALDWYERNMPIFDDRAKSFGAYHNPCPDAEQPPMDTPPIDSKTPSVPKSWDPNEMVGEEGVGEARYVKPGQELTYTIYFENKAGFDIADAQEVKVTNPLSEWLDWSTFEMREVAFNNQCDVNLDRLANGSSEVQMNGTNKYVRTTVECDAEKGVVTWYMRVYDPNGDSEGYPTDGSGFLPSNDDTHRGEGHLTYRIKVREDAPANVVITNSASIVFDLNDPIETDPAWWNTVRSPGAQFSAPEVVADEGGAAEIRVSGGSADAAASVKVYLTYNTAAAADVDLAKGTVDGTAPKGGLKFPLLLTWEKGEMGEKVITIPVKTDKTVEDDEFFTLQLAESVGMELGEERVCTVTIRDMNDKTLKTTVTPYKPKKNEMVATNSVTVASGNAKGGFVSGTGEYTAGSKLTLTAEARPGWAFVGWATRSAQDILSNKTKWQIVVTNDEEYVAVFEKIPYVRGLADPADGGKVSGSGLCAAGKKVTLKASANKNFTFLGWVAGASETCPYQEGEFVATTASLVIDRSAKPAANSKTSTTVTEIDGDVTYYAVFKSDPEIFVTVDATDGTGAEPTGKGAGKYVAGTITGMGKYAPGKTKIALKAAANKGYVFAGWFDADSGLLTKDATYTVAAMGESDVEYTARFVTAEEDKDSIALGVNGAALSSAADVSPTSTNIWAGVYLEWPVAASALSEAKVKVAGLPSGLKFTDKPVTSKIGTGKTAVTITNVPANTIYGAPTAASKMDKGGNPTPSAVKFTVTTAGKSTQTYQIDTVVDALPTWAQGTFAGGMTDGGQVSLTVSAAGKTSGKALGDGLTYTLAAPYYAGFEMTDGVSNFLADVTATWSYKEGTKTVKTNDVVKLVLQDNGIGGYAVAEDWFEAYTVNWKVEPWKTLGKSFDKKTFAYAILPDGSFSEDEDVLTSALGEEVVGRVTLKFAASGAVTIAGEFAMYDENKAKYTTVKATGSATLVPVDEKNGEVFIYLTPKGLAPHVRCIEVPWPEE